jgi:hypothetical protein
MTFLSFFHIKKLFRIRPDPDPEHCFDGLWQENAGLQERAWWGHSTAKGTDLRSFESHQQQCQLIKKFARTRQKTNKMRELTKIHIRSRHIFWLKVPKQRPIFNRNIIATFSISVFLFCIYCTMGAQSIARTCQNLVNISAHRRGRKLHFFFGGRMI